MRGDLSKTRLKAAGYADSFWHISDVKHLYSCSDETAAMILEKTVNRQEVLESIWSGIKAEAIRLGLKEKVVGGDIND